MMLRTFIALTPPPTLQATLAAVQACLQPLALPWRWIPPAHIHLTLKFLGDIPSTQLPALTETLTQVAQQHRAFPLHLRALGCFPHPTRPRVLWVGVTDQEQALHRLHATLLRALHVHCLPPDEHPFHPHLTLARIRETTRTSALVPFLQTYQTQCFGSFDV
ncbi:MAG: RNA 2',3'-cyclic phosphodiesterase, partial [Candidatus Tectomicrobia bacterium]|nr:RNA 2',3'-cyclic phosphodiesterase [Candidatus Tectomicrobia bacterium]